MEYFKITLLAFASANIITGCSAGEGDYPDEAILIDCENSFERNNIVEKMNNLARENELLIGIDASNDRIHEFGLSMSRPRALITVQSLDSRTIRISFSTNLLYPPDESDLQTVWATYQETRDFLTTTCSA